MEWPRGAEAASPRTGSIVRPMVGESRRDILVFLGLLAVAIGTRLFGLGAPAEVIFDELYYAKDACVYVFAPDGDLCPQAGEFSGVPPPLGKWLISVGIA